MSDDYALLDFGGLRRLEQWGRVRLVRPDPKAVGTPRLDDRAWADVDARFDGRVGQGAWTVLRPVPDAWVVSHAGLRFEVKLAPSMHTGLFPEQAGHWTWIRRAIDGGSPPDVLNLFGYTGGASVALAALGCTVTHVDTSRPAVAWARRNAALNAVSTIRWIEEDVRVFVQREHRRARRYRGLILDPPAFGRTAGRVWRLDHDLEPLLDACIGLLEPDAAFILLNLYGLDAQPHAAAGLLADRLDAAHHPLAHQHTEGATLDLQTADGRVLATGAYARVASHARAMR
jgi:23S rRNA (cytosine1962-C5)-methyltransferase